MNGVKPNKAMQARFDLIMQTGCVICLMEQGSYTPPQIHHIDGAKTQEAHAKTIGLCYWHHMGDQQQPKNERYTSRHPNKAAFEERYLPESELLEFQNGVINERERDSTKNRRISGRTS